MAVMAKKKISVVIADDQTLFREGIKDLLENEKGLEVVGEASDGVEALRLVKKLKLLGLMQHLLEYKQQHAVGEDLLLVLEVMRLMLSAM